ncbi:Transposable element Tcb1 transposase [Eumeta japonica]|uniref:Transposable element Tcb1 transposase n=1 Tax=Eumeta variegata TaxID=151549 RepID=A0A4C1TCH4_EUMVA|nr:Transposable element Tcb1 transposase [Eumeta japonica]
MSSKQAETTDSQRKIILHLHSQGKSYAQIGEIVERSRFTVRSIVKRFKGGKNFNSASRSGRPRALTDRESKQIVRKVKENPKKTSTEIAAEVKHEFGKAIHPMTVRRVLHEANYSARVARRKPLVSLINQKKRLNYAKEFSNKPISFWDEVLFSDESKFNIFGLMSPLPLEKAQYRI